MNTSCQEMIVLLLEESLRSELDLTTFCEEFSYHYLQLEEGKMKNSCKELFYHVSNYLMSEHTNTISLEEIKEVTTLFDCINKTHKQLMIPKTMN